MKIISLNDPIISFQNHPKALLEYAAEKGADFNELLAASGLSPNLMEDYQAQISYLEYKSLIASCYGILNDPLLGLHFGEKLGFHGHGLIGFAAMACHNVGEAIETAIALKKAVSPITNLELKQFHNQASLTCMPAFEGGEAQRFFVEVLFAALMYSLRYNIDELSSQFSFYFSYAQPTNIDEYHRLLGTNCVFNAPQNRICCSDEVLKLPLKFSNPAMVQKTRQNANSNLQELNNKAGFLEAMREFVSCNLPEYPSIDEVARHFNVSRSTLKRRLQTHNTSYKTVIDEIKMNKACELLESSPLSVDEISSHLYFSEGAAFRRAFKRCCGMSPSEYRKKFHVVNNYLRAG